MRGPHNNKYWCLLTDVKRDSWIEESNDDDDGGGGGD